MDIFKIVGKIALDGTEEFNQDINEAKSKGASLATAVGNGLSTVAKIGAAVMAAAGTAVVAVSKASLDMYAEYEQLVGGVQTLFGDSADLLQQYAQEAFKTAGISANEYMTLATSFSASLLQSLGGDTAKAVEYADMAIQDMSDNVNKFGSSMESVQLAYAGFAKQNFTMLDNLKLGYGGTRTEMERLLKDANRINKEYGITTNYTIDNLSDIYEAIHVIQNEMGIAGATQLEAATTIQGSLAMAKASWQNLLVAFADSNLNLDVFIDNFVSSVEIAAKNIVPRLSQILGGLSSAIAEVIPVIMEELPVLIEELLPGIIEGAGALIQGLAEAIPELLPVLWDALGQIGEGLWNYIFGDLFGIDYDWETMLGDLSQAAENAWKEIEETWNAIGQPIWDIIVDCVGIAQEVFSEKLPEATEFFSTFCEDIDTYWNETLQPCLEAIGQAVETLAPIFETVFSIQLTAAVEAAFSFVDRQWNEVLLPVLTGITTFLLGVFSGDWKTAFEGLGMTVEGLGSRVEITLDTIAVYFGTKLGMILPIWGDFVDELVNKLGVFVFGSEEKWEEFRQTAEEKIASVLATATSKFNEIKTEIATKINDAALKAEEGFEKIRQAIEEAMGEAFETVSKIWGDIKGIFADAVSVGKKLVDDIKQGIQNAWPSLKSFFKGLWDGLFGNLNANVNFTTNGNPPKPEATGLNYVPYDEFPALLHQGEAVLNSVQARAWRSGEMPSNVNQDMSGILMMILEAIQEGNNQETVFKLNNREFGRAVRGVAHV